MKKVFNFLIIYFLIFYGVSFGEEIFIPMIPLVPASPNIITEEASKEKWELKSTHSIILETKMKVVVPLEIISDVKIQGTVIDDETIEIPFELEMNKAPIRRDYYALKYNTTEIDIDGDGKLDTKIYSPKYINEQVIRETKLVVNGKDISKEGVHRAKVYVTVEVKDN